MADVKFTIEYCKDKRSWKFKDPIEFDKEVKKIVMMMIFSQSIKYLMMGEILSKVDKKKRRRLE